jgi:hypothetical protein
MKNLFIIACLCLFNSIHGYTQPGKGRVLLGGSVSAGIADNEHGFGNNQAVSKGRSFAATPKVGLFISDRWVVGLSPTFSTMYQEVEVVGQERWQTSYGLGLFARYYRPVGEQFSIFGEITGIDFGQYRNRQESFNPQQGRREETWDRGTYYRIGAFLGIGAAYFFTPRIAVEASFGSLGFGLTHLSGRYKDSIGGQGNISGNNKAFAFSLQPNTLNLGVNLYLGQ